LDEAGKILSKLIFEKKNFKKTFNTFADNIYSSDPDRATLYLEGGATPKNEQSIAYLLRNGILTNVENLQAEQDISRAEVAYLIKEKRLEIHWRPRSCISTQKLGQHPKTSRALHTSSETAY